MLSMYSGQNSLDLEVAAAFSSSVDHDVLQEVPNEELKTTNAKASSEETSKWKEVEEPHGYPIHIAAGSGDLTGLAGELAKGTSVDLLDRKGQSALAWAAAHNQKFSVIFLLRRGANTSLAGPGGNFPLSLAASQGYIDICHLLLKAGADIDALNEEKASALIFAAFRGRCRIVELLLENGADLTVQDIYGNTALSVATSRGKHRVVKIIEAYLQRLLESNSVS